MSKQTKLWSGEFGDQYHDRNKSTDRTNFWRKVLRRAPFDTVSSVLEAGAGRGDNLAALRGIYNTCKVWGVEVNMQACVDLAGKHVSYCSKPFLDAPVPVGFDLVVTRGFLIHVPDDDIDATLRKLYQSTRRYIAIAEYYSPVRRQVEYHGLTDALWLDDYAGRLLEMYEDLELVDFGFDYYMEGGHDLTWFLMEKKA